MFLNNFHNLDSDVQIHILSSLRDISIADVWIYQVEDGLLV